MKIDRLKFISFLILLIFSILALISCQIIDTLAIDKVKESNEDLLSEKEDNSEEPAEENGEIEKITREYQVAYFEIGIDENSNHFEHRVANIYAMSVDGDAKKLIYSDINDKYALTSIYGISPDGTKILCGISDDARGVYSALCFIDIINKNLIKLVEFDFSEEEEVLEVIYRNPIWSNGSDKVAYETITKPFEDDFRDGGIHLIDINTGIKEKLNLDINSNSPENDIFFYPILFSPDDTKIIAAFHPYFPKIEDGKILDYYTKNESLNMVDIESGESREILNISQFEGVEAEIISSFDRFNIFKDPSLIVFQVLGDFEEDGDIWASDLNGEKLTKLTNDNSLREQEPSILDVQDLNRKIAFIGVYRYGTISEHTKSGNIYIIDFSNSDNFETINCEIEGLKPLFSTDEKYLAFMYLDYDENYDYVENYQIKTYNIESGELKVALSTNNIIDLIGWILLD